MAKCIVSGMGVGEVLKTVDGNSYKWAKAFKDVSLYVKKVSDDVYSKEGIVGSIPVNGMVSLIVNIGITSCNFVGRVYTHDYHIDLSSLSYKRVSIVKNVTTDTWIDIITSETTTSMSTPVIGSIKITNDGNLMLKMKCGAWGFDSATFTASLSVFLI